MRNVLPWGICFHIVITVSLVISCSFVFRYNDFKFLSTANVNVFFGGTDLLC